MLEQNSGGTESGHYVLAGQQNFSNGVISTYLQTLSRTTAPVSVLSFDTADVAPAGGMGTISTGNLTSGGFQIFSLNSTNASNNARAAGNWTVQF